MVKTFKKNFTLKNAEKIFPAFATKVRSEDLIRLSIEKKKLMTKTEIEKMQILAENMNLGKKGFCGEYLIARNKKKLKRIDFCD